MEDTEPALLEPQIKNEEDIVEATLHKVDSPPLQPSEPPPQPAFASVGVQALPGYSVHEVNSQPNPVKTTGMNHTEGGWPAEVDPTDGEQVARWRKKIERDEDYIRTVLRLGEVVEGLVRQNNALDIYTDYFADVVPLILEPPGVSTLAALSHPMAVQRAVQALSWSLDGSRHIAAAFAPECTQIAQGTAGGLCSIFDAVSPTTPLATLTSTSPALCLAHNFRDHSLLGAGQCNGQFALFDVRQGPEAVGLTDPGQSHSDCLTSLAWTQSKTGTEFMTAGLDGNVIWWDSRRLTERVETLSLRERSSNNGNNNISAGMQQTAATKEGPCFPATCLEYSIAAGPAKFMVGTSSGAVLSGNRRAKTPADRITGSFTGHAGPVVSLSRHPFFPKHFLSIGDWTARIWCEDLHTQLVATPCRPSYYSAGAWSQSRPSVFYCTAADGSLEAWDLLKSHSEPAVTANVADCALTCLAVQDTSSSQGLFAVGCKDGTTLLMKPSAGLDQSQGDEKTAFAAMMEREIGRERGLEKAGKEAKARARKEAARAAEPVTRVSTAELEELEKDILARMAVAW